MCIYKDCIYAVDVGSFSELKTALETSGTVAINLTAEIVATETIYMATGTKTITGNEHTIWNYFDTAGNVGTTSSNCSIIVPSGGTLNLNNTNFNGRYAYIGSTDSSTNLIVRGICNVNNCTFSNGLQAIHVYTTGTLYFNSGTIYVDSDKMGIGNLGTVYIKGGTITATADGVHNNGGKVYISGGNIKGSGYSNSLGINNFNNGTVSMTGGYINSWTTGISNGSGTVTMSAGNIYSNTSYGIRNVGTTTFSGGTIYSNSNGIYNTGALTVSGGTLKSNTATNGSAIYHSGTSCVITAGTFTGQNVYLSSTSQYVTTNTSYPTFTVKPNSYSRGRVLVKTSGSTYATNELSYLTLYANGEWLARAKDSNIVVWDKCTITVKYVDEEGTELTTSTTSTGWVNDSYTTSAKSIDSYRLKTTPSNASGTYPEADTTVTYIYEEDLGDVYIKYIDQVTGDEIYGQETSTGYVGDSYTFEAKEIDGYELVTTPSNATGSYTQASQEVVFEYRKLSTVTVNYIDEVSGDILSTVEYVLKEEDSYTTSAKSFTGYTCVSTPSNATGVVEREDISLTYYYRKNAEGVDVKYIDQVTNEEIAILNTISGLEGNSYTTQAQDIDGYELVVTPDNASGTFTVDKITVVYEYRKLSTVTVNYIDITNNETLATISVTLKEGDTYTSSLKSFDGYMNVSKPVSESITVEREDIELIYEYEELRGQLTILRRDSLDEDIMLQGSIVKVEKLDNNGNIDTSFSALELETDIDGKTDTIDLEAGTYTITEMVAPEGYNLYEKSVDVLVENQPVTITLSNVKKLELPKTGAINYAISISLIGLSIICISIILVKKNKIDSI